MLLTLDITTQWALGSPQAQLSAAQPYSSVSVLLNLYASPLSEHSCLMFVSNLIPQLQCGCLIQSALSELSRLSLLPNPILLVAVWFRHQHSVSSHISASDCCLFQASALSELLFLSLLPNLIPSPQLQCCLIQAALSELSWVSAYCPPESFILQLADWFRHKQSVSSTVSSQLSAA